MCQNKTWYQRHLHRPAYEFRLCCKHATFTMELIIFLLGLGDSADYALVNYN